MSINTVPQIIIVTAGQQGPAGTPGGDGGYMYVAYADDALGTGFTNNYNSSKDYIAFKQSAVEIPTPQASDFAGLWKNYKGATGAQGPAGNDGADGIGVPAGGTTGQILAKNSNTNYDTEWVDDAGGTDLGWYNVMDYGASGSNQSTTGSITSGSPNLTLALAKDFQNGQGIMIMGAGAAGANLVTSIVSGGGTVNLVLADNAATTVAGAVVRHDDGAAIVDMVTAANAAEGGTCYFPKGVYCHATRFQFGDVNSITFLGDNEGLPWLSHPNHSTMPANAVILYTGTGSNPGWHITNSHGLTWRNICISYDSQTFSGELMRFGSAGVPTGRIKFENCKIQAWEGEYSNASVLISMPFLIWAKFVDCTLAGAEWLFKGFDTGLSESANCITIDHCLLQVARAGFFGNIGDWWTIKDNVIETYPFPYDGDPDYVPECVVGGTGSGVPAAYFDFFNNQVWDNLVVPGETIIVKQPAGTAWSATIRNNFFDSSNARKHFEFNGTGKITIIDNAFQQLFGTNDPVIDLGDYTTAKKTLVVIKRNSWSSGSNNVPDLVTNLEGHEGLDIDFNATDAWSRVIRDDQGQTRVGYLGGTANWQPSNTNLAANVSLVEGQQADWAGWIVLTASGGNIAAGRMFDMEFAQEWIPHPRYATGGITNKAHLLVDIQAFGIDGAASSGIKGVQAGLYYIIYPDDRTKISFGTANGITSGDTIAFKYTIKQG